MIKQNLANIDTIYTYANGSVRELTQVMCNGKEIYTKFEKFNAFQTLSTDWIFSGKGTVSLASNSIYIACPAEYATGTRGSYEYKKSIKVSNKQSISFNVSFANDRYMNLMLYLYYKLENSTSWKLLKLFDGSMDGANPVYITKVPVTGKINLKLSYGVSGYNCPVNINITKFAIE